MIEANFKPHTTVQKVNMGEILNKVKRLLRVKNQSDLFSLERTGKLICSE